jgi:hypothetical protein
MQIPVSVACEFQQKVLLMAAMGDVPELARQEVAVGAWHVALPGALALPSVTSGQAFGMTILGGVVFRIQGVAVVLTWMLQVLHCTQIMQMTCLWRG